MSLQIYLLHSDSQIELQEKVNDICSQCKIPRNQRLAFFYNTPLSLILKNIIQIGSLDLFIEIHPMKVLRQVLSIKVMSIPGKDFDFKQQIKPISKILHSNTVTELDSNQ